MNIVRIVLLLASIGIMGTTHTFVVLPDGTRVPHEQVQAVVTLLQQLSADQRHPDPRQALCAHIMLYELYDSAQTGRAILPGIRELFINTRCATSDGYIAADIRAIIRTALSIQERRIQITSAQDIINKSTSAISADAE